MLEYVAADCPREEWLRIAAALKEGLGDDGWPVFEEWSQGAPPNRYDARECRRMWDSLTPDGGVSWGTLVQRAGAAGWKPPTSDTAQILQWPIRELDGTPVAIHYRMTQPNGGKKHWWGQPEGNRGLGGRKARTLPLYGAELLADTTPKKAICIVEGEKTADALREAEPTVLALGTVTGAASCPEAGVLKPVVDADLPVYLWPDADTDGAGARHMERVAAQIVEAGGEAPSIIEWPDAPPKGDAADWATADKGPAFADLASAAVVFTPKRKRQRKAKAPAPQPADDPRPVVEWQNGDRLRWTRQAVEILTQVTDSYQGVYGTPVVAPDSGRNVGYLVTFTRAPSPDIDANVKTPKGTLKIDRATERVIKAMIDRHIRWRTAKMVQSEDGWERKVHDADVTVQQAGEVLDTYRADSVDADVPRFPTLRGIVDTPTLRRDGSLMDSPGHDHESGLFGDFDDDDWKGLIPDDPTRDDARRAIAILYDLVKESAFKEPHDKAVWVAYLLTIIARQYISGNAPMFGFSANIAGLGKGTLVDLASIIATSHGATKWTPISAGRARDAEDEERKRLMSVCLEGIRSLCIDNVPAGSPIGTPALDGCITSGDNSEFGSIADRILGMSATGRAPWTCVVAATGNNMTVKGDMGRRLVLCKLETRHVEPEKIQYCHHPDPHRYARENRRELLCAALTILLAHRRAVEAGDPDAVIRPWINSFGNWSDRIRSAVAWADPDGCDPWLGNAEVKADAQPEKAEAKEFFAAWYHAFGGREVTAADIERRCRDHEEDYDGALAAAVRDLTLAPPRPNVSVNTRSLGTWLTAHADYPGPFILRRGTSARKWFLEKQSTEVVDESIVQFIERTVSSALSQMPEKFREEYPGDEMQQAIVSSLLDPEFLRHQEDIYGGNNIKDVMLGMHQVLNNYAEQVPIPDIIPLTEQHKIDLWNCSLLMSKYLWFLNRNPLLDQLTKNFLSLPKDITLERECVALSYATSACRKMSGDATMADLANEATKLLVEGANLEAEKSPDNIAEIKAATEGIEAAIKELCGIG